MENVQKTRRLFASAYGCKASRSFLIWSLSAAMSISVAPMMAEVSADVRNFGTQLVTQVKRVTGTIIDETGEPMIGVSVLVQGTTTGTVTDLDGKFVLEIPANATLVISYIGYKTQNIKVGSQHAFAIKMESDNEVLDEVVVIGYQTIKRKDLTGSVASVSGKTVSVMPVSNVAQAMQGKLPGVNITSQDGRPDAAISIRVRGGGSISQSNEPLILVDGVTVNSLNDIPSDQVESIDVLKDASSTAIYGARGANGVILVTTKGAKEGKVSVSYNGYVKFNTPTKYLETLDPYDYLSFVWANAAASGDAYRLPFEKLYGIGDYSGSNTGGIESYRNTKNYNIQKDVYNSSVSHNHDLSVSGGTEKTKVLFAMNYMDEEGMKLNSYAKRGGISLKVNQKLRDNLDINLDTRYSDMRTMGDEGTTNGSGSLLSSSYRFRPIATGDILGDLNALREGNMEMYGRQSTWDTYSPVARIGDYDPLYIKQRLRGTLSLNWRLFDGFAYHTDFTLNQSWEQDKKWGGAIYNNYLDDETGAKLYAGNVEYTKRDSWGLRWTNTVSYDFNFLPKQHRLNILLGHEVTDSGGSKVSISASHFPSNFTKDNAFAMINQYDAEHGTSKFSSGVDIPGRILSFFGRANYTLMDRYLFTVTFRADGSSKFAPSHQWGYFPAAAAAWRISDEAFMENTRDWLDNLKLRVSYGTSGSDNIDASLWRETWKTKQITVDGEKVTTYVPGDMKGNPDLKWETTISRNLGVDFGFFNNWVRGSLDYYWNTTKNILMKVPIDAASGYSYQFQNVGKTSNKGIELALGFDIVRGKDFNLGVNLTYNYNKNNIDELMDGVLADTRAMNDWGSSMAKPAYDYIIREGQPVGTIQGFKSEGYYMIDDFTYADGKYTLKPGVPDIQGIVNYPDGVKGLAADGQTAIPGMPKFADTTGDGVVDEDDKTIIGKAMPQHTGGFTINGNWKAIDFSVGFTYQIGGDVYNANAMHSLMGNKDNSAGQNRLKFVSETFKYYDVDANGDLMLVKDPTALAALNANTNYSSFFSEYGIVSSKFIEDASYLRLNTLTVGYTFPKNWMNKIGLQNARVYFTGSNLFCIDGYSGIDPDVNTKTDGKDGFPTPYFDYQSYPKARTYTFGVNLTF